MELDPDPDPDEMNADPQPWFSCNKLAYVPFLYVKKFNLLKTFVLQVPYGAFVKKSMLV
jgi:hypothetical protein